MPANFALSSMSLIPKECVIVSESSIVLFLFEIFFKVLVDGPQSITGIHRQVIALKRISLTDIVIKKLPRNATQKNITKAWTVSFV
jgi:hypothetical protein